MAPKSAPATRLALTCAVVVACWASVAVAPVSSVRAATSALPQDIPAAIFFGPQLSWENPALGETPSWGDLIIATVAEPQKAYRVGRWRWRRAASPQSAPHDIEILPEMGINRYRIQADDIGFFLSACTQFAVAPDMVAWYCTNFIGPVTGFGLNPSSSAPCTGLPGSPTLPPLPLSLRPAAGRWRLSPALDGYRWHHAVDAFPWPDGGWAVAELQGRILRHRPGQEPCLLLDLTAEIGRLAKDNGLLSMALDPRFPELPFIYVYYTRWLHGESELATRLSRFPVDADRIRRDEELVLLETEPFGAWNHFGGGLRFGPDGLLYLTVGDRGMPWQAQELDSLLGKMIRLDVRGATRDRPYRIPASNPWRNHPQARAEAYARGFRNPWRIAFDPADGTLWVADVGAGKREEVNRVQAGANYGWPLWEGDECRAEEAVCAAALSEQPVAAYGRGPHCAVIGGIVYRGAEFPVLDGAYIFGDHCSGHVWALTPALGGNWRMRLLLTMPEGMRLFAFATDTRGAIYLLTLVSALGGESVILQLEPA